MMNEISSEAQAEAIYLVTHPINTKTLRGAAWIGRNSPCYCGSKMKFKNCCWWKHSTVSPSTLTPETAKALKKSQIYLQKQLKKARDEDESNSSPRKS